MCAVDSACNAIVYRYWDSQYGYQGLYNIECFFFATPGAISYPAGCPSGNTAVQIEQIAYKSPACVNGTDVPVLPPPPPSNSSCQGAVISLEDYVNEPNDYQSYAMPYGFRAPFQVTGVRSEEQPSTPETLCRLACQADPTCQIYLYMGDDYNPTVPNHNCLFGGSPGPVMGLYLEDILSKGTDFQNITVVELGARNQIEDCGNN